MSPDPDRIVYIVDDDEAVRDSTRLLLESQDIAVRDFASPRAFLAAFDAAEAACIVLDLHMPEMSGLELLEMLRGRGIATPVVVVSGRRDGALDTQIRRAGVSGIFSKPYDDELLLQQLKTVLAGASG
jgi:two-component system response regulator FixJ